MSHDAIGIFDSGIGGTSIWKEIHQLLPQENTIYLADSANAPYGERSKEEIIELSIKNTEKLLELGSKIIVVACNTATTNAIKILRNRYPISFIGIEPAIKPAALQTKTKTIGILATKGTLSSELFSETSEIYAKNIEVVEVIGSGLVELIEQGELNSTLIRNKLLDFIQPMIAKNIDHLVLGCSHYPYLIPLLQQLLDDKVTIIDSGQAVARQTHKILEQSKLLNSSASEGNCLFYTNASLAVLKNILQANNPNYSRITVQQLDF
ncbi:glutamate racemase [Aquimarina brevivitae]|uniref:Glutamate racemase n=1 Tax=Aquimarina brevivitae TaxID=323412 RepID=A0A4Q7PIV2_9FLAO|nr:glutamate racemase [Aquimarina brevivitae]RZS98832.1 glutamate racemase [Aquimarina brevivitae]